MNRITPQFCCLGQTLSEVILNILLLKSSYSLHKFKICDFDSDDDMAFTLETRGDLYEPEDTEEELLQRETEQCWCVNCKDMFTDQRANVTAAMTTQLQHLSESEDSSEQQTQMCISVGTCKFYSWENLVPKERTVWQQSNKHCQPSIHLNWYCFFR